ncbi:Uncharacterized protein Adt_05412 [Abeliophyllum distichum]|uniref:Uncharacterized protein n=1 Tax=Abeliophyllum distichum TaxID=126358 RepID=A0ABD1V416_9LAMI
MGWAFFRKCKEADSHSLSFIHLIAAVHLPFTIEFLSYHTAHVQTSATYADVHPERQPCYLGGIYRFILEHPCCNGSPTGPSKGKLYHGLDGVVKMIHVTWK